jgi:hypothetical protein
LPPREFYSAMLSLVAQSISNSEIAFSLHQISGILMGKELSVDLVA